MSTKLGMEMPTVAKIMEARSGHLPRRRAEMMPSGMPSSRATRVATKPTLAETGKPRATISFTDTSSSWKETPRSPCRRLPMYLRYCTETGWSSP